MNEIDWQMALISAVQADPEEAIAQLSGAVSVALTIGFTDAAWQRIEEYLADDGLGTEQERETQAALLRWLKAERCYGLIRENERRLKQLKEDGPNG
jgi:hypothetical protein